jgi:hypothetical protein
MSDDEKAARQEPRLEPRQEAEPPLTRAEQVILDIRRDIQKSQAGGSRKEMVDALKDQFLATRHQAATKVEAVRMLALEMLRERLHEVKTVPELMRVIATLSKVSEADLATVYGVAPGSGPMVNIQQHLMGSAGVTQQQLALPDWSSKPFNRGNSQVLESFEALSKIIKERNSGA